MTLLRNILISIVLIFVIASVHAVTNENLPAISFSQFFQQCLEITRAEAVKLTSDEVEELRIAQVDSFSVLNVKEVRDSIVEIIKNKTTSITISDDMIVVKDNHDGDFTRIYINPDSVNAEILIVDIEKREINIVKVNGNVEAITRGVSIRGKNLEGDSLK